MGGEDRPISDALLRQLDYVAPNESELARLTGLPVGSEEAALAAAQRLRARGARAVLLTLGPRGALLLRPDGSVLRQAALEPPGGKVVDATAAGDAFRAAFAVALVEGRPLQDCLRFAAAAGGLAVSRMGAVPSLPHRAETEALAFGADATASGAAGGADAAATGAAAATCSNGSSRAGTCSAAQAGAAASGLPPLECPFQFASRLNSMHARRDVAARGDGGDDVLGWVRQGMGWLGWAAGPGLFATLPAQCCSTCRCHPAAAAACRHLAPHARLRVTFCAALPRVPHPCKRRSSASPGWRACR